MQLGEARIRNHDPSGERKRALLAAAVLALCALALYSPVLGHYFVNLDDPHYVTANPHVLRGLDADSLAWAFTPGEASYFHPLSSVSLMLDVELFGPAPGWMHLVNAALHALSGALLFLVIWRMTRAFWPGLLVAALFLCHPLSVESVAWITERKNVLSTLFWMLTMHAWVRYAARPSAPRYALVALVLALGLLAKPMLVTLPAALLLLDYWPLRRATGLSPGAGEAGFATARPARLILEKLPLFALVLGSALVTVASLPHTSPFAVPALSARLANALISIPRYLALFAWPADLAVFYPFPAHIPPWQVAGAAFFVLAVTALALWQARLRPYLLVGWLWYVGTLVPVLGLIGYAKWPAMADRFTYVPLIGVYLALSMGLAEAASTRARRIAVAVLCAGALFAFSVATRSQLAHWKDSLSLLSRAAAVTENNWLALNNLGAARAALGEEERAAEHYRRAIELRPDFDDALFNLGAHHLRQGRPGQALEWFGRARKANPANGLVPAGLGAARAALGECEKAIALFEEAYARVPETVFGRPDYGRCLADEGESGRAVDEYIKAANLFALYGNRDLALELLDRAGELEPWNVDIRRLREEIGPR